MAYAQNSGKKRGGDRPRPGFSREPGIEVLPDHNLTVLSAGWTASADISSRFTDALEKAKARGGNENMIKAVLIDSAAVGINETHVSLLEELG
ncbi:MAG: hypothetical protein ABIG39_05255 [Candidatus Micrarchaeota archaeon]